MREPEQPPHPEAVQAVHQAPSHRMGENPEFQQAVANTPDARLDEEGLHIRLIRRDDLEHAGEEAPRTGINYIGAEQPEAEQMLARGRGRPGGQHRIEGWILLREPYVVRADVGNDVLVALDQWAGRGSAGELEAATRLYLAEAKRAPLEHAYDALGVDRSHLEQLESLFRPLERGPGSAARRNHFFFAVPEMAVAAILREHGYDSLINYWRGPLRPRHLAPPEPDTPLRIQEVFDVREATNPTATGQTRLNPGFPPESGLGGLPQRGPDLPGSSPGAGELAGGPSWGDRADLGGGRPAELNASQQMLPHAPDRPAHAGKARIPPTHAATPRGMHLGPRESETQPHGPEPGAAVSGEGSRDYSSTQLELPTSIADRIRYLGRRIPARDLAEDGREPRPHVTVKYGLETADPEEVRSLVEAHPPISVRFGKTSVFPAAETGGTFDVVKVDVEGPELRKLNAELSALPNGDAHPEYSPHATVAYVKPGLGEKYAGQATLEGKTAQIDRLSFTGKDGTEVELPLLGKGEPTVSMASEGTRGVREPALPAEAGEGAEARLPVQGAFSDLGLGQGRAEYPEPSVGRYVANAFPDGSAQVADRQTGRGVGGIQPDLPSALDLADHLNGRATPGAPTASLTQAERSGPSGSQLGLRAAEGALGAGYSESQEPEATPPDVAEAGLVGAAAGALRGRVPGAGRVGGRVAHAVTPGNPDVRRVVEMYTREAPEAKDQKSFLRGLYEGWVRSSRTRSSNRVRIETASAPRRLRAEEVAPDHRAG